MPAPEQPTVYNAHDVVIELAGVLIQGGAADGEFLTIERQAELISYVVGTLGEVAVSINRNMAAIVTLRLLQTSSFNDLLSARVAQMRASPSGIVGVGPFLVRDLNGRTMHRSQRSVLYKAPNLAFDRTATPREWQLLVPQLESFDGGNNAL